MGKSVLDVRVLAVETWVRVLAVETWVQVLAVEKQVMVLVVEKGKLVQAFEKGGMTFTLITPENRSVWDAPLKGIEEEWISKYEKMGLPARKVFEQFKKIALETAK